MSSSCEHRPQGTVDNPYLYLASLDLVGVELPLLMLVLSCHERGEKCQLLHEEWMRKLKKSWATIKRAIHGLETKGWLTVTRRKSPYSCIYALSPKLVNRFDHAKRRRKG